MLRLKSATKLPPKGWYYKTFFVKLTLFRNKLECFSASNTSSLSLHTIRVKHYTLELSDSDKRSSLLTQKCFMALCPGKVAKWNELSGQLATNSLAWLRLYDSWSCQAFVNLLTTILRSVFAKFLAQLWRSNF